MMTDPLALIRQHRLVVIARKVPVEQITPVAQALLDGGIALLEATFDQSSRDPLREAARLLSRLSETCGDRLCIGAGTVLSVEQVETAARAGARYIVSPNTNQAVIEATKRLGLVSIPGAMTPTEILNACSYGADIVKLFPADNLGYAYIRNIRAPLCHVPLLATGGVNPETIPKFFDAGVEAVGTGVSIIRSDLLQNGDYDAMSRLARAHVAAIKTWLDGREGRQP
jgi:2-dehydro-3-deoxyphosphogluconate aldolase/(4S)-4-hydroxy-2-oxoglutarate aldolase